MTRHIKQDRIMNGIVKQKHRVALILEREMLNSTTYLSTKIHELVETVFFSFFKHFRLRCSMNSIMICAPLYQSCR